MTSLTQQRTFARQLLNENSPVDALACYFALHHDPNRTRLFLHTSKQNDVDGFLVRAQTGMDLFKPIVTLRAATDAAATDLFTEGLSANRPYFMIVPLALSGVVNRTLSVSDAEVLKLYRLDPARFQSQVNVMVVSSKTPDGMPRFEIRRGDTVASMAGLNWRSPQFAEVSVYTEREARGRGWGKAVVSALVSTLIKQGVTPIYLANEHNEASIALAESVGFVDTGAREYAAQVVRLD